MGRKRKELTQEQIDCRNSILRGKVDRINQETKPVLSHSDKIKQCFFYLNNCVFWVNEYIEGRVDKKRLLETAIAMQENAKKLEILLHEGDF